MTEPTINTLPEFADNPFISNLPPILSRREMVNVLTRLPSFDVKERNYPPHIRKYCVLRLVEFFVPIDRHLQYFERVDMTIRQGYRGKNPNTCDYISRLQDSSERLRQKNLMAEPLKPYENFASSFALLGTSGVGKTRSTNVIFQHFPQTIRHEVPFRLTQIVWLRLDCPSDGDPKQLCTNFFNVVDMMLGTNYRAKYAQKGTGLIDIMLQMQHVANLHAIGCLVIDEIQFLNDSHTDSKEILGFFVTLVNTIGIPIILIGTNSAIPLLQQNFKEARRAIGLGSSPWDALENNEQWKYIVTKLWEYQWLSTYTPLTEELINTLHEETQGIVDILIKLFMIVQMRIISINEVRKGTEEITSNAIRKVAKDVLKMVKPMLDALRERDTKALLKYDDLLPFQSHFNKLINEFKSEFSVTDYVPPKPVQLQNNQDDVSLQLIQSLKSIQIADDIACGLVSKAISENPSADVLQLMVVIGQLLNAPSVKPSSKKLKLVVSDLAHDDLRAISVKDGEKSFYENLLAGGVISDPLAESFA